MTRDKEVAGWGATEENFWEKFKACRSHLCFAASGAVCFLNFYNDGAWNPSGTQSLVLFKNINAQNHIFWSGVLWRSYFICSISLEHSCRPAAEVVSHDSKCDSLIFNTFFSSHFCLSRHVPIKITGIWQASLQTEGESPRKGDNWDTWGPLFSD